MPSWLVEQDAKRQACGQQWRHWTPEQWRQWRNAREYPLAIEDAARGPAAVAVTQDGAQEQPAVAGSAVLPPPPPPPPTPPPPPASPRPASEGSASTAFYSDTWPDEQHDPPHPSNAWYYRATDGNPSQEQVIIHGFHGSPAAIAGGNVDPIILYRMQAPALQQLLAADEPAVAGAHALTHVTAVAGAAGCFDKAYFDAIINHDARKYHNHALKWFRELAEEAGESERFFDNAIPVILPLCVHTDGPNYRFDTAPEHAREWQWQSMVAQLNPASKNRLLMPGQYIRTCCIRVTGRQDFKTQRKERDNEKAKNKGKVLIEPRFRETWDFVLTYGDGHTVYLHPSHQGNKVQAYFGQPPVDEEVPQTGRGGSDGRGTFKKFSHKGYNETLTFGR